MRIILISIIVISAALFLRVNCEALESLCDIMGDTSTISKFYDYPLAATSQNKYNNCDSRVMSESMVSYLEKHENSPPLA